MVEDPDENPSLGRAAGWTTSSLLDFGLIGAAWAVIVAIWARARRRHRRPDSMAGWRHQ